MRTLLPDYHLEVDDEYLLTRYGSDRLPFIRFNFVSSVDGSAQLSGLSGQLGSEADHRVFMLQRRFAHVILVGSGTVHAEGYEGSLVSAEASAWRTANGYAEHPVLAIVSRSLSIDPESPVITQSPAQILIFTSEAVEEATRRKFPHHVELIQVSMRENAPDPEKIIQELTERGLTFVHAEGGPRLFGQFADAKQLDSLCLSFSPLLVAGQGSRICIGEKEVALPLTLHTLLEEDSMLLAEYRVNS